jgi:hypothetical protein
MRPGTFIFLLFLCYGLRAQTNTHGAYWLRYQNQLNFNPKFSWTNEIDNRRFFDPDVQNQLIFHSRVHYRQKRWDYGGGLTLSWVFTQIPESPARHATTEIRPVAEASYELPFKKFFLQQRVRIDNRFIEEDKFESVFDGANYIMRLRYRIQARIPLKKDDAGNIVNTLRLAEEIMLNHKENIFDQNRIYVSSEFALSKKLAVEFGYIYIYQQRFGTDQFLTRHVLRFSVLHRLFFYKAG